jgi:AraC family transcriptional regulator of adaptative response / DNA-3-methyladenine glycosylase II
MGAMSFPALDFARDFDLCYQAVASRDGRFDGWFIVGVRTTGIYCRPSCPTPVKPKASSLVLFKSAAAAQLAGFRACKRCRPDAIPGSPEWDTRADLTGRAIRLIADGTVDREGVAGLARRLAVSERHLHRVVVDAVGAPPLALARSQRAQTARVLIETTGLPFGEIAFAAGFPSIRQFNDTIRQVFALTPTDLRRTARRGGSAGPGRLLLRLPLRAPYDATGIVSWLGRRVVPGLEEQTADGYRRVLSLPAGSATVSFVPKPDHIQATFRLTTVADLGAAVARCRRLLDLDADPGTYGPALAADPALAPLVAAHPGTRAPGSLDGAEAAVRTVLAQQASLATARTLAGRLVMAFGKPLDAAAGGVTHAFPDPALLADAPLESIGLTAARAATLRRLATAIANGELVLDAGGDRVEVRNRLLAIPGVGPWTAEMIALRALRDPDAFPVADLGLRRAGAQAGLPVGRQNLIAHAERWRPWRAYAAHYLWRCSP